MNNKRGMELYISQIPQLSNEELIKRFKGIIQHIQHPFTQKINEDFLYSNAIKAELNKRLKTQNDYGVEEFESKYSITKNQYTNEEVEYKETLKVMLLTRLRELNNEEN